jgi:plasmid stabilization system protein ParE
MPHRVILSPGAKADIRSAIRWYVNQQLGLPLRFGVEYKTTLRRVAQNPYQFPLVNHVVRRALLNRFPYAIYFTVSARAVFVTAVLHQRRLNPWCTP